MNTERKIVKNGQAIIMVVAAILVIFLGIKVVQAPTAIILLADGVLMCTLACIFGIGYGDLQNDIKSTINSMIVAIIIVLAVGILVGTWMVSGTVPLMIYYGMKVITPGLFLPTACILCTLMSTMAGTSWGTVSTVGIACMGVSAGLGIPLPLTAGAVTVGAIFGDKLSPLSDSTVLSTAVIDTPILDGIKRAMWSTGPAYVLSLVFYFFVGQKYSEGVVGGETYNIILSTLESNFTLNPLLLIPPILVFVLILMKKPTLPVFTAGIVSAVILGIIFQGLDLTQVAAAMNEGFTTDTGNAVINSMLRRGGMKSMLGTVALLIAAGIFGAPLRTAGVIDITLNYIVKIAKNSKTMALGVLGLHGAFFSITGSYYVSYSVLGPMVTPLFDKFKLDRNNLARIMLDTGTGLAPMIPWSTTGVFIAQTLNVPTMDFVAYAPMLWLSIIFSIIFILTGFTMKPSKPAEGGAV